MAMMIDSHRFMPPGGGSGSGAARWRIYVDAVNTGTQVIIGELQVRETAGGADEIGSATLSASSTNGANNPSNVSDGLAATAWKSNGGTAVGEWLEFQFGSPKTIREIVLTVGNTGGSFEYNASPNRARLQYYDGSTWLTAWGFAFDFSSNGQVATLTGADPGAKRYWRLLCTQNHGSGTFHGTSEIELRATVGGADQCSGGTALSSTLASGAAADAFDNSTTTYIAMGGTNGGWVGYDFGLGNDKSVEELLLGSASAATRSFKRAALQSSSDGSNWQYEFGIEAATFTVPSTQTFARPT